MMTFYKNNNNINERIDKGNDSKNENIKLDKRKHYNR